MKNSLSPHYFAADPKLQLFIYIVSTPHVKLLLPKNTHIKKEKLFINSHLLQFYPISSFMLKQFALTQFNLYDFRSFYNRILFDAAF